MPKATPIQVQWGKEKITIDLQDRENISGKEFKQLLLEKTGVPIERQSVLGLTAMPLKDDEQLVVAKIAKKKVRMIGTADKIVEAPTEKINFIEDQEGYSDEYSDQLGDFPQGLKNLGNTCYANATLQCFKAIPEVLSVLQKKEGMISQQPCERNVIISLRDLLVGLKKAKDSVAPFQFITELRKTYPQFAALDEKTQFFLQQDADEFMITLLEAMRKELDPKLMEKLFKIETETTFKCLESDQEPVTKMKESQYKLECDTQEGSTNLYSGLEKLAGDTVTKSSQVLGRDAMFEKKSKIVKLPNYVIVHFNRFFWKKKEQIRTKILKEIKFPTMVDLFDFCSEEKKQEMKAEREKMMKEREETMQKEKEAKLAELSGAAKPTPQQKGFTVEDPENINLEALPEENKHGWYDLVGVITHKGREANSGHYIGWCKDKYDRWFEFDDDKITARTEDDIKKLSGGGDWHTAYVLVYKSRKIAP